MTSSDGLPIESGEPLAGDLLWGVEAIAAFIDRTPRQTYQLVETQQIPFTKMGGRIVGSRSALRRRFAAAGNGADQDLESAIRSGAIRALRARATRQAALAAAGTAAADKSPNVAIQSGEGVIAARLAAAFDELADELEAEARA
jgi:hypothetical protein